MTCVGTIESIAAPAVQDTTATLHQHSTFNESITRCTSSAVISCVVNGKESVWMRGLDVPCVCMAKLLLKKESTRSQRNDRGGMRWPWCCFCHTKQSHSKLLAWHLDHAYILVLNISNLTFNEKHYYTYFNPRKAHTGVEDTEGSTTITRLANLSS